MRSPLFRSLVAVVAFTAPLSFAAFALGKTITYRAELSGKNEVPPNTSPGTGRIEAEFDSESMRLTWIATYSGLTGPATTAHFHGPAKPGENGGAEMPIPGPYTSPIKGEATLTPEQAADLENGLWYLNVHTATHKKGELRGQLTRE